jgi:uncharacterized protein (DUF3820 family)
MSEEVTPAPDGLLRLVRTKMPFGRYAGTPLVDLPEPYVVWLAGQELPAGELGRLLQEVYEIKVNGRVYLFKSIPR